MPMFTYDVLTQIIRFYGRNGGLMGKLSGKEPADFHPDAGAPAGTDSPRPSCGDNPIANTHMWGDFLEVPGTGDAGACPPAIWNSPPICSSILCSSRCRIRAHQPVQRFRFPWLSERWRR